MATKSMATYLVITKKLDGTYYNRWWRKIQHLPDQC